MKRTADSRKSERQSCLVPVDSQADPFDRMRTVDISRKGLGLISNHPLAVGEDVAVKVDLSPEGRAVVVWGKVRWVQRIAESGNYRLGIRFTDDVIDGTPGQIEQYLKSVRG